jgi:hypothetical protein
MLLLSLSVIIVLIPVLYQGATLIFVACTSGLVDIDDGRYLSPQIKAMFPASLQGGCTERSALPIL